MATGLTPHYSLSYPLSIDPVNVASDIEELAQDIDAFLENPSFNNNIDIEGGSITTFSPTANVFNSNVLTLNIGGAGTAVTIGSTTGTTTIRNANTVVTGDLSINGGDLTTSQTTFNLINTNATTLNIGEFATIINVGASAGQVNIRGNFNIGDTKVYKINDINVLSASALGSGIVSSSLTTVGTLTTGVWNATTIAVDKGGTGLTSYTIGDIIYASASTTLAKLPGVATGNALISGGIDVPPSWGKIDLTTHISGTLPVANGGTGTTSFGTGIATWLGTPSSANLAAAVTDETGSGSLVFASGPSFSGTPTAPTAAVDTNTTQIATTAFVVNQAASATPLVDGVAAVGTSLRYARQDHVHPTDTTRAPLASPTFTGTVSLEGSQILMESATTGSPTNDVSFTIERGTSPNVEIRWNETLDIWQFTNNGSSYEEIGSGNLQDVLMFAGM